MARRKPSKQENGEQNETQQPKPETVATAKVTLVKPAQEEEKPSAAASGSVAEPLTPVAAGDGDPTVPLSLARPKFGRAPSRAKEPTESAPSLGTEIRVPPLPEAPLTLGAARVFADEEHPPAISRAWDSRFALFLLALFVAINLGLIALLHHGRHASGDTLVTMTPPPPPANTLLTGTPPSAPGYPRVTETAQPSAARPLPPAAAKTAPAAATVAQTAPVSAASPASPRPLMELPAQAKAPAKPVNSPSAELMAIINKD